MAYVGFQKGGNCHCPLPIIQCLLGKIDIKMTIVWRENLVLKMTVGIAWFGVSKNDWTPGPLEQKIGPSVNHDTCKNTLSFVEILGKQ